MLYVQLNICCQLQTCCAQCAQFELQAHHFFWEGGNSKLNLVYKVRSPEYVLVQTNPTHSLTLYLHLTLSSYLCLIPQVASSLEVFLPKFCMHLLMTYFPNSNRLYGCYTLLLWYVDFNPRPTEYESGLLPTRPP
jgi:hypothetical protein